MRLLIFLWLITVGVGFLVLGILVALSGIAHVPIRAGIASIEPPATYALGLAWAALGLSLAAIALITMEVGPRHHLRMARDTFFLLFALAFLLCFILAIRQLFV